MQLYCRVKRSKCFAKQNSHAGSHRVSAAVLQYLEVVGAALSWGCGRCTTLRLWALHYLEVVGAALPWGCGRCTILRLWALHYLEVVGAATTLRLWALHYLEVVGGALPWGCECCHYLEVVSLEVAVGSDVEAESAAEWGGVPQLDDGRPLDAQPHPRPASPLHQAHHVVKRARRHHKLVHHVQRAASRGQADGTVWATYGCSCCGAVLASRPIPAAGFMWWSNANWTKCNYSVTSLLRIEYMTMTRETSTLLATTFSVV